MPNRHPAFQAGEHVKFAKLDVLRGLQEQFGVNGPQGRKWIHRVLAEDMTEHAETYVRIKSVGIYHFGTVLYEFDGISGCWLEPTIVDQSLNENSEDIIDHPASCFYTVTTDSLLDQEGLIEIRGAQDNNLFCVLRKSLAGQEAKNISEVSHLRTKPNFERMYGFDGLYGRMMALSSLRQGFLEDRGRRD